MKVLGIVGSLRKGSYNRSLLHAAQQLAPQGMIIDVFDIDAIPLYNADNDGDTTPQPVLKFKDAISAADALLFATPEYNYGIPGVLKNAIDWASRPPNASPLNGKKAGVFGATTGMLGTARSQGQLRQVLQFTNTSVMLRPEVYVAKAHEKFDDAGKLIDEGTRKFLAAYLEAFGKWVAQG